MLDSFGLRDLSVEDLYDIDCACRLYVVPSGPEPQPGPGPSRGCGK